MGNPLQEMAEENRKAFNRARGRGQLPRGAGRSMFFNRDQFKVIDAAVNLVRVIEQDEHISEARAVELALLEWMGSHGSTETESS